MCEPLTIAATAMSAIGTGVSAMQAAASSRYQAKVADQNVALENEAAHDASEAGKKEAARQYRRIGQIQGQQQAALAAGGADLSFGSALDVQRDTANLGAEDVKSIYDQTSQNVRSHDINAANFKAQAQAARQAATGALVKGAFDVGSSVLGGVTQYKRQAWNKSHGENPWG